MKYFYSAIAIISALMIYQIIGTLWYNSSVDNIDAKYTIGPQDADLSVVEFLSYNCHYCNEMHPTIMEAVKRDGNVLYIPRPIGNENDAESMMKAILAYSAGNQGKFTEIQESLYENFRPIDEDFIADLTNKHDLNSEQFNKDFGSQKMKDLIEKNNRLFLEANGTATPTFIIGGKLFYVPTGKMPTTQDFLDMFNQARTM